MSGVKTSKPGAFLAEVERRARDYPIQTTRITDQQQNLRGLSLLLDPILADKQNSAAGAQDKSPDQTKSCQVTVEERSQLFEFFKDRGK
ncbi:MAG: hypothetical protein KKB30_10195 [Proteobacteria bacterium]|nr:hypothetical protein [Pseudomonadota bacterium]MBU1716420.1 hypothetical protein [Pseudomonadota bacterium]